jgi:hypothetical protein
MLDRDKETYLGGGLYASFDGLSIWLRAPRKNGDHMVALEPSVYAALAAFARDVWSPIKDTA